mmetsp:Transcript_10774/g.23992  ORF Transcript_10774/g.23992 Transcript_10774/m.23992 type:complete len:182 (+) Transcript_10774:101-646(+)
MDALALLEGASDDDDDDVSEEGAEEEVAAEASEPVRLDFQSLQKAGYSGNTSLCDTEMYRRLGAPAPPRSGNQPEEGVVEASIDAPTPPEDEISKKERLEALARAAQRDRKRVGVAEQESVRKKNARKMKLGQANFSLKDDRDCVNPFVDHSNAPHVKGYGGKRLDRHSSAKQISSLSFTS